MGRKCGEGISFGLLIWSHVSSLGIVPLPHLQGECKSWDKVQYIKICSSLGERLVDVTEMMHLVLWLLYKYGMRGHGNSTGVGEGSYWQIV